MDFQTIPPVPANEPIHQYLAGSPERLRLEGALQDLCSAKTDIAPIVDGKVCPTTASMTVRAPHDHGLVLGEAGLADTALVDVAIESALTAQQSWAEMPFADRAAIFLKAAELLSGPWRARLNAATMLGQSKTVYQAEIDSACELADFLRFNVAFATRIYQEQPASSAGCWNTIDYRPLEGFVYAVTPFNFTEIAGNLASAPVLMGGTVVWKPSDKSLLSNFLLMELLQEAGLPPGVINFVPGDPVAISDRVLAHPALAGIHYTGSTEVFRALWQTVSGRFDRYRNFPRMVGETGGKDFVVAHPSADEAAVVAALIRGAFEYQGQKCSAASRAYIPQSLWPSLKARLQEQIASIRMGDVRDFGNFMGAVIDGVAYRRLAAVIDEARNAAGVRLIAGGTCSDEQGYFVSPTVFEVDDPRHSLMLNEFFGPLLAIHVYPDARWSEMLATIDSTSSYALTGAVFARDRAAILEAKQALRNAAGNFYVNDKPTGAVVGQQPFGGARASGTNDKAGSMWNLTRWVSPRTIKETFVPAASYDYPYMRG
ncbi:MAG: L-glutamate gamma-semialdehyde dehydrogenase [Burkholderiaceae bacterium]